MQKNCALLCKWVEKSRKENNVWEILRKLSARLRENDSVFSLGSILQIIQLQIPRKKTLRSISDVCLTSAFLQKMKSTLWISFSVFFSSPTQTELRELKWRAEPWKSDPRKREAVWNPSHTMKSNIHPVSPQTLKSHRNEVSSNSQFYFEPRV